MSPLVGQNIDFDAIARGLDRETADAVRFLYRSNQDLQQRVEKMESVMARALKLHERSVDPPDPREGNIVLWLSDGTGSGSDGDLMAKATIGGTTTTFGIRGGTGEALVESYIDFDEVSPPADPPANILRMYAAAESGFGTMHFVNSLGIDHELARDRIFVVRNNSGGVLSAGEVVYVTGSTGVRATVDKAKADSSTTLPAFAVVTADISDSSFGQVMVAGDLPGLDTSAFNDGDELFVSDTTAGGLIASTPTGTSISQKVGTVIKAGAGASGIIEIDIGPAFDPALTNVTRFLELSSDPADPGTDEAVMWVSDGTGTGSDGDLLIKTNIGGVVQTASILTVQPT